MDAFITHYTKLKDRKEYIDNQLLKAGINGIFINEYDKEDLTFPILKPFDRSRLKLSQISLFLKHVRCWELIIENDLDYGIIFEDDVVLEDDFVNKLNYYMKELPEDFDYFSICDGGSPPHGLNIHIDKKLIIDGKHIYKINPVVYGGTRCAEAQLVSKKCAQKMIDYFYNLKGNSISVPLDHFLNQFFRTDNSNVYWLEPTIASQLSSSRLVPTTLI
jgi:GR25 family glycosyltransferase involved in LPS biosynthesis